MSGHGRNALIVGASSGIGWLTAEKLLDRGFVVYAAARGDTVLDGAQTLKMDVTDDESVIDGVEKMISEEGRIDVLYANAGYGSYGTIENVPIREIQNQFNVNVFGAARVLKAVLPHMREQRAGRVIITASIASHFASAGIGWYASTKHALAGLAMALRQEVKGFGIDVVLIEPGGVSTPFHKKALEHLDAVVPSPGYEDLLKGFRCDYVKTAAKSPGPESTARAMVKAGTVARPKLVYRTTLDSKWLPRMRLVLSDRLLDWMILRRFRKAAGKC